MRWLREVVRPLGGSRSPLKILYKQVIAVVEKGI